MKRVLLVVLLGACGGARGVMRVDTPLDQPYHSPDLSDITGIDDDDTSSAPPGSAPAAPAPAGPAPAAQPTK